MTEAGTWGADQAESRYALRGGEDAKRRLDLIAGVLQPTTATLLDQVGIEEGSRCLDVGRGGGHVVAELARRVGPGGSVLGLDLDPTVLDLAAQSVDGAGNVTFRQRDARALQGEGYDVVYAPFLLIHLADVADALRRMAACRLGEVGLRIAQPAFMTGPVKHVHTVTLTSISESLVAEGMVPARDARTLHADMTRYADDETTIVTWPRIVQAWGRLPATGAASQG